MTMLQTILSFRRKISPLAMAIVVLPSVMAVGYFGFFAEDLYVSESRVIVRAPYRAPTSSLSSVLQGDLSGASEESDAVREYVVSRGALEAINSDNLVREAYGDSSYFFLDRFGSIFGSSEEQLYEYYLGKVSVQAGAANQVVRLRVEAFDPVDAKKINERLLQQSELLVNALSTRGRADAIQSASEEVQTARDNARNAVVALSRYRDEKGVIDPELQASANLQMISNLQAELIDARTRLQQMRIYTPEASQIPFLETQVQELEAEINQQMRDIAGSNRSLSATAARYQELQLSAEFAQQQLTVALAALQDAQVEARRKQAYVERISQPSLADYPSRPRRVRGILATIILGLLSWGVIAMLIVGIREHRD